MLAGGCGGQDGDVGTASATAVTTPAAGLPCAATAGLDLPSGWPAQLPLPAGLVVTRTERRSGDRLIAYGRVPGDFHAVVAFFDSRLPAAGLRQSNGQLDPRDAESDFTGTSMRGRWTSGLSVDCAGTSEVSVLVLPVGAGNDADTNPDADAGS